MYFSLEIGDSNNETVREICKSSFLDGAFIGLGLYLSSGF